MRQNVGHYFMLIRINNLITHEASKNGSCLLCNCYTSCRVKTTNHLDGCQKPHMLINQKTFENENFYSKSLLQLNTINECPNLTIIYQQIVILLIKLLIAKILHSIIFSIFIEMLFSTDLRRRTRPSGRSTALYHLELVPEYVLV